MPKNTHADSKPSADKRTLNPAQGGAPGQSGDTPEHDPGRNQMQPTRDQGQFTAQGKPGLQKK
jgi:hypothetical protein